jgi:hypothetical protein
MGRPRVALRPSMAALGRFLPILVADPRSPGNARVARGWARRYHSSRAILVAVLDYGVSEEVITGVSAAFGRAL